VEEYGLECGGVSLAHGQSWVGELRGLDELNQELLLIARPDSRVYRNEGVQKRLLVVIDMWTRERYVSVDNGDNTDPVPESEWELVLQEDVTMRTLTCPQGHAH
jgi:hypothetical protein